MFEKYYLPIPDADEYLRRIGITEKKAPSLDFLNELIYAHQTHVPFENVSQCVTNEEVRLEIDYLFNKIVESNRGGYCFELNCLFQALLSDLGFNAYPIFAKVVQGRELTSRTPILHRGTAVRLDNEYYYCDVGFGGAMPAGALLIDENTPHEIKGDSYKVIRFDEKWYTIYHMDKEGTWNHMLMFSLEPQENVYFMPLSAYGSLSKDCPFSHILMVNMRTPTGSCSINDRTFTLRKNGSAERVEIKSEDELKEILRKHFDISV